jgi:hypothetical protein
VVREAAALPWLSESAHGLVVKSPYGHPYNLLKKLFSQGSNKKNYREINVISLNKYRKIIYRNVQLELKGG